MWECMLCVCGYLQSPEGVGSPGAGVKGRYELSDMGTKSQTLEEQHMLSTAKPSLQSEDFHLQPALRVLVLVQSLCNSDYRKHHVLFQNSFRYSSSTNMEKREIIYLLRHSNINLRCTLSLFL